MNWPKVKTLLLVLLLIANIILFGNYLVMQQQRSEQESRIAEDISAVCAERGVTVPVSVLPAYYDQLASLAVVRNPDAEARFADKILGDNTQSDLGGGIFVYTSHRGTLTFRTGGQFELTLEHSAPGNDSAAIRTLVKLFGSACGFSAENVSVSDGVYSVNNRCNDFAVFNSSLTAVFTEDKLTVSGRSMLFQFQNVDNVSVKNIGALLLGLIDTLAAEDREPTEITSIEPGYAAEYSGSQLIFTPIWRIESFGQAYFVNAVTGAIIEF